MKNEEIDLVKYGHYKDRAIKECKKLSFIEKTQGLWLNSEIIEYFTRISLDEPNECLASSLRELLPDLNDKKILCIGGGTGRLGRSIIGLCPGVLVTEIDSSKEMVACANRLAIEQNIEDRFISIEADAKSLPFRDCEYDHAIAYGVFRYIHCQDYKKTLSEISRVSGNNFTVSEPVLKDLICILKDYLKDAACSVKETTVSMFRMSLFYMLLKEYKQDNDFKIAVDGEVSQERDYIEILTLIAGMAVGTLYELRVRDA